MTEATNVTNQEVKAVFEKEDILKYANIQEFANKYFAYINDIAERINQAKNSVGTLHIGVRNNGTMFDRDLIKPDVQIKIDKSGAPFVQVKGRVFPRAKVGNNLILFPSRYRREFTLSLQTWGDRALQKAIVPEDITVDMKTGAVHVNVGIITIYPDNRLLVTLRDWLADISNKLPLKIDDKPKVSIAQEAHVHNYDTVLDDSDKTAIVKQCKCGEIEVFESK